VKVKRIVIAIGLSACVVAFLFLAPVVSYPIPPISYACPANRCQFLRYESITYWALGTGAMLNYAGRYSLSVASISQGVLTDQNGTRVQVGCYLNSSGGSLCVQGAPTDSIADWYNNGTITVTYPNGYTLTCDPSHEATGPCGIGFP
jgi:hypothetical protein